jgi:23S rRNA (adenine2503-C2)-methyltransferase
VKADASSHPLGRLPEEWACLLAERGESGFRARQVFRWLHARGVANPELMTDLGRPLRDWLAVQGTADPARLVESYRSADGTRKLVLGLSDGVQVECVLIPMTDEADAGDDRAMDGEPGRERVTLCVSTQHGCAMGCSFCASGQYGLGRSLAAHEIVAQVIWGRRQLRPCETLRNLVFMGMGEPLANYAQTARAIRLLTHPAGCDFSPRRITVSTVGLVPGIDRLGQDFHGQIGLALSLHAADDETRRLIVPHARRHPIDALIRALRRYPLPRRRRITIEYTLIAGVNDRVDQAERLALLLRGLRVKLNLIPMNRIRQSRWGPPSPERVEAFREALAARGYSCFVRTPRGDDVAAACGQLGLRARGDR